MRWSTSVRVLRGGLRTVRVRVCSNYDVYVVPFRLVYLKLPKPISSFTQKKKKREGIVIYIIQAGATLRRDIGVCVFMFTSPM